MKVFKRIYSVYDKKAQYYLSPFVSDNEMTACRFVYSLYDSEIGNVVEMCSDDFDLYCLGEFDNQGGTLVGFPPEFVCHVSAIFQSYAKKDRELEDGGFSEGL